MKVIALSLAFSLAFVTPALAQGDGCQAALQADVEVREVDLFTSLAVLQESRSSTSEAVDEAASGRVLGSAGSFFVGASERRTAAREVMQRLNIDHSFSERNFLFASRFSDKNLAAYEACLGARSIVVRLPRAAITESEFFGDVTWRPTVPGPHARLRLEIVNGAFLQDGAAVATLDHEMQRGSHLPFRITARNPALPTQIRASLQTEFGWQTADSIDIPARIRTFHIETELVKSDERVVRSSGANQTASVCVVPTGPGWSFVPGSHRWNRTVDTRLGGERERWEFAPDQVTPNSICGYLFANGNSDKTAAAGGIIHVNQYRVVATPECDVTVPGGAPPLT